MKIIMSCKGIAAICWLIAGIFLLAAFVTFFRSHSAASVVGDTNTVATGTWKIWIAAAFPFLAVELVIGLLWGARKVVVTLKRRAARHDALTNVNLERRTIRRWPLWLAAGLVISCSLVGLCLSIFYGMPVGAVLGNSLSFGIAGMLGAVPLFIVAVILRDVVGSRNQRASIDLRTISNWLLWIALGIVLWVVLAFFLMALANGNFVAAGVLSVTIGAITLVRVVPVFIIALIIRAVASHNDKSHQLDREMLDELKRNNEQLQIQNERLAELLKRRPKA